MELLYLWIDWYNNIKNQEFLFSNEFNIKFDRDSAKLEIARTDNYKQRLFNEAFINVSALIGKNGSGKSSIFSMIKEIFSDSHMHFNKYILVTIDNNTVFVFDEFSRNNEKIKYNFKLDKTFALVDDKKNNFIFEFTDLIFHSNSFSIYDEKIASPRFYDISFSARLNRTSLESNKELIQKFDYYQKLLFKEGRTDADIENMKYSLSHGYIPEKFLYHYDLLSKINFISKYSNKNWKFVPKILDISLNQSFFYNNKKYFEDIGLIKKIKELEFLLFEEHPDYISKVNQIDQFKNKIIIYLFLFNIKHWSYYNNTKEYINKIIKAIDGSKITSDIPTIIKKYYKNWEITAKNNPYKEIVNFINALDSELDEFNRCGLKYKDIFTFLVTDKLCSSLQKIFGLWHDNDFIFYFDWGGLSAGESAILTLFSKIHSISKNYFKKSIWILIDEGDLYLHPEWQRTFFSDLHEYLPLFFEKQKIHLFLTSHSPFIVSDLPKENIILLDKDRDGFCKVIDKSKLNNTFGANINTLFTDSFFLNQGLIGEFAKEKILNLLNEIEHNDYILPEKYDEFKNRIEIIGEPLIKEKLSNLLYERFLSKDLKKKKAFLQKEIDKIDDLIKTKKDEKNR